MRDKKQRTGDRENSEATTSEEWPADILAKTMSVFLPCPYGDGVQLFAPADILQDHIVLDDV